MDDVQLYDQLAEKSAVTLEGYLKFLIVDSRPPARLNKIVEPWQRDLYNLLTPLFESAAGHRTDIDCKAAFITAARGHAKTSMLAQLCIWSLCFSRRPLNITVAASDKEQSHIFLDRIAKEAAHNSWLSTKLKIHNFNVVGPTGHLSIISSDAPSSSGKLDDITICDEVCWWKKRDLMDILMSGRAKRKDGVFIVISNSGCLDTWQYELLQTAKQSTRWVTHEVPPFSASWLDRAAIEDDKKILLPSLYRRLHENVWIDPAEENQFITREQIEACVNCQQQASGKKHRYFVAMDYGSVWDRSAACVMHAVGDDVYLDALDIWQGSQQERMQVSVLEQWLKDKLQAFHVARFIADPYQLEQLCQRFERHILVERFSFSGGHHVQLAENLRSLILNKRLHIYPHAGQITLSNGKKEDLVDEISSLIIEEKGQRWRFQHLPGKHDDLTIVIAMSALYCIRERQGSTVEPEMQPIDTTALLRKKQLDFMNAD